MRRTLAARLATLEHERYVATCQWWNSLSEAEQQAVIDERFGVGTWDWLGDVVGKMTLQEVQEPGRVWRLYLQWRETQP
jgi:hypothetical protein